MLEKSFVSHGIKLISVLCCRDLPQRLVKPFFAEISAVLAGDALDLGALLGGGARAFLHLVRLLPPLRLTLGCSLRFGHAMCSSQLPSHIVYIDEGGDPGLAKVKPIDPDGASEWMVLGAVVIRARLEPDVVAWVRNIRAALKDTQGPDLHFRTLSDHRRGRVAEMVAELPIRAFVLASHKVNMRGHHNRAAEAMNVSPSPRGWFYNWCVRLLLERVTRKCADASQAEFGEVRPVKLVFSQRGGVKYNWLKVYLEVLKKQAEDGTTVIAKREIVPETINPDWIEVLPSRSSAGCQLADVIASAFLTAADASGPRWSIEPAKKLRPRMAHDNGVFQDCGLSLQPAPPWRAAKRMTSNQKAIFCEYGVDFK